MAIQYKIEWNKKGCGRCGGTGVYHFSCASGASKGTCYGCRGRGYTMSSRTLANRNAYSEWRQEKIRSLDEILAALKSGKFGKSFKIVSVEVSE